MPKGVRGGDIAPMLRRAFVGAAKRLDTKGKSLTWLIEQELESNTLATLKVMASFNPRQVNVDKNVTTEINQIIQVVTQRQKEKLIKGEVIPEEPKAIEHEHDIAPSSLGEPDSITPSFTHKEVTVEPST